MPRWYWWIAGVFVARAIGESVSVWAAVVFAAALIVGYWTYRVGVSANEAPSHRAHAARREVRRIGLEVGEAFLGWALILLVVLGIAAIIATWPPNWKLVGLVCVLALVAGVALFVSWRGASNLVHETRARRWKAREAELATVLAAWSRSVLSTAPPDRALVERVVASVYARRRRAGVPTIQWAGSPPTFARLLEQASGRRRLHRPPPWWVFLLPYDTGLFAWSRIWDAAEREPPRREVEAALAASAGTEGLDALVTQTSWFSFRRGLAILLERPVEIHLDENGELHGESGPAVRFADGWCVWALRGVVVPGQAVEDPDGFDPLAALRHDNVEVRRALLDHLGWDRVVRASGLTPHAEDEHGRLWRLPVQDEEPLILLEVENATPDHDGTRRRYFLRVPPDMRSPREATAWTFGLSELEYAPDVES